MIHILSPLSNTMCLSICLAILGWVTGRLLVCLIFRRKSDKGVPMNPFITELGSFVVFGGMVLHFGLSWETAMWLLAVIFLMAISLIDVKEQIISDKLLVLLGINRLFFLLLFQTSILKEIPSILGGVLIIPSAMLILTLIMDRIVGKETMGGGDIKLMFVLGLYLDWKQMFFMIFASSIFGLIWVFGKKILNKRKGRIDCDSIIAFGPFLFMGCVAAVWFGRPLLRLYVGLF